MTDASATSTSGGSSATNGSAVGNKRVSRVIKPQSQSQSHTSKATVAPNASASANSNSARSHKPAPVTANSVSADETKRPAKAGIRSGRPVSATVSKSDATAADSKTAPVAKVANPPAAAGPGASSSSSSASFSRPTTSSRRHTSGAPSTASSAPFTSLVAGPDRPHRVPWSSLRRPQIQRQAQESHLDGVLSEQKVPGDSAPTAVAAPPARDEKAFTLFQYEEAKPDRHKSFAPAKGGSTLKPQDKHGILHWKEDTAAAVEPANGKVTAKKHYDHQRVSSDTVFKDASPQSKARMVPQIPGNYSNMNGILPTPQAIVSQTKDDEKSAPTPKASKVKQVGGASSISFVPDSSASTNRQSLRATGKGTQSNNIFTPDTGPIRTGRALVSNKRANESSAFHSDSQSSQALSPRTAKAVNAQKNASHLQATGSGTNSFLSTDAPQAEQKRIPRKNVTNTSSVFSHYTQTAASSASAQSSTSTAPTSAVGVTSSKAAQRPVLANSNGNILTWK